MNLPNSVAQATICLVLVIPPMSAQIAVPNLPQIAANQQSWLGLGIVDIAPSKAEELGLDAAYGVEVAQVATDGPAQQAGIERGDIITLFRNERVQGAEHLARLVRETPLERTVTLELWRDGERQEVEVVIQQRGGPTLAEHFRRLRPLVRGFGFDISRPVAVVHNRSLGVEMESLKGQFAEHFGVDSGVLIRSVDAGSRAADSGIAVGDVIVSIGTNAVRYPNDVRREIQGASSPVNVGIVRNKRKSTITLPESEANDDPWPLSRHTERSR